MEAAANPAAVTNATNRRCLTSVGMAMKEARFEAMTLTSKISELVVLVEPEQS